MLVNFKQKPFNSKYLLSGLFILATVSLLYYLFSPATHYRVGNIFFGGKPALYNVNFSQYFFKYASYPLFGDAPVFAHYQLSRSYFIQGELEASLQEAHKELEVHPDNHRTYYILGLTYGYLNREEKAIEAFSKFIEAYPESWAARNDKAWLQFRVGDIEGALVTIAPVKDLQNPWVQNTYGALLLNNDKKAEAKEAFLIAQDLVSNMTEKDWGRAYPGNDPRIYDTGLEAMRLSITNNLKLIAESESILSSVE